jgi:hypothetical protein
MNNKNGLITGVVMVIVFIGGFTLGYIVAPSSTTDNESGMMEGVFSSDADTSESDAAAQSSADTVPAEGTTLNTSAMSDGQRKLLESLGVDADSITLTPEMLACAEEKLGNDRMTAVQNGETPSFFEGTKLMACYTAG